MSQPTPSHSAETSSGKSYENLRRRWPLPALLAALLLPVTALLAAAPVTVATPGPMLPVESTAESYSRNLHVPTVYFTSKPAISTFYCRLTAQCETVPASFGNAKADTQMQAASSVSGVDPDRVLQAPPVTVDAVGTSAQLASTLYYVTYALQTPLLCPTAATGSVTADGDVLAVTALNMKQRSSETYPVDVLLTPGSGPASVHDGVTVVPVRTVQQAYDYLLWSGCLDTI